MTSPNPSLPAWLTGRGFRAETLALFADPALAAEQRACDDVLRTLMTAGLETDDLRARLQNAMWTKANFNIVIDGRPLIHHIIERRDLPTLLLTISGGRGVTGKRDGERFVRTGDTDAQGRTPLDYARAIGWDDGAKYLELYGHNDTAPDYLAVHNLQTDIDQILAMAAEENDLAIARAALEIGANPDVRTRGDLSAFHHCILLLHGEMASLLAEYGADIFTRHCRGETPLQMLWWCHMPRLLSDGWYDMAARLRDLGCDSDDFKTPREMTAQELIRHPRGAYSGTIAMDFALKAHDFATYRRGLMELGANKAAVLLSRSDALQSLPVQFFCHADALQEIFRADLWLGQRQQMVEVWNAVREASQRPHQWRDNKPCSFTPADFSRVLGDLDRAMLANGATKKFRL